MANRSQCPVLPSSRSSLLSFFPADLFRPGKLNVGERWRGGAGGGGRLDENGGGPPRPKARLRNVEEILQTNSMTHATYHVPPGKRILSSTPRFLCHLYKGTNLVG